jgi:site-specific DNA-methyltransferase (adenine-specific)
VREGDGVDDERCRLILGDCRDHLATLPADAAIVSDPPYGINHDTDYTRFTKGKAGHTDFGSRIVGDDRPFDPTPWLTFSKVVLFGANCYSDRVPPGTLLVWCKRRDSKTGKFLSDCEVAWRKGGRGVYLFHHYWDGFDRESERGKTFHPTQKPVALMRWCIERLKLKPDATIVDPYMGSGSTGVAVLQLGFRFIGIECDPTHYATARRRVSAELARHPLLVANA